jgi:hypothetical protein
MEWANTLWKVPELATRETLRGTFAPFLQVRKDNRHIVDISQAVDQVAKKAEETFLEPNLNPWDNKDRKVLYIGDFK